MKKIDYGIYYAILAILFITFLSDPVWKYLNETFSWIEPIYLYNELVNIAVLILPAIFFIDRKSISSIGFSLKNGKKIINATIFSSVATLIIVFLTALFWKQFNQLRIEDEFIYFVGQQIPMEIISSDLLYVFFISQMLTVAIPEEIVYRGYLQSRLNIKWSPLLSIAGSTFFFAMAHIDRPLMLLHLLFLGTVYGYAYHYSKSIIPTIIAHYLSNIGGLLILKFVVINL